MWHLRPLACNLKLLGHMVRYKCVNNDFTSAFRYVCCYNVQHNKIRHICHHKIKETNPRILNTEKWKSTVPIRQCHTHNATLSSPIDPLKHEILQHTTAKECLDFVAELSERPSLGPQHVSMLICHLADRHYTSLNYLPWLQHNMNIAYIQLLMSGRLKDFMNPIRHHPQFPALCDLVDRFATTFNVEELTDCFLALMYLAMDQTDPTAHTLLHECHTRTGECDSASLKTMSFINKTVQGPDFVAIKNILARYAEILDNSNQVISPQDFYNMATIFSNMQVQMSNQLISRTFSKLARLLDQNSYLQHPDHVAEYCRISARSFISNRGVKNVSRYILSKASEACWGLLDQLEDHHIAEICSSLHSARCYDAELGKQLENRAMNLLSEDCQLHVLSNLAFALSSRTSEDRKHYVESLIYTKLLTSEVDVIVLTNLVDSMFHTRSQNRDLLRVIQKLIIENVDIFMNYMGRYFKLLKLVGRRKFIDRHHEMILYERLLTALDGQHGIGTRAVSTISQFLIRCCRHEIPDLLFEKLILAIPKWREPELYRFAVGLNAMKRPQTAQMRRQLSQIHLALYTSFGEKLQTMNSSDHLHQFATSLILRNPQPDPVLSEKIMNRYLDFINDMTDVDVEKAAHVFTASKYYLPEMLDILVDHVLKMKYQTMEDRAIPILNALVGVGYSPQKLDRFGSLIESLCHGYMKDGRMLDLLHTTLSLTTIQYFPERLLADIFSLDFIEDLDRHMADNATLKERISQVMMQLNRCIVLEYPQLDVPWFHEEYCRLQMGLEKKEQPKEKTRFVKDVSSVLHDTLGNYASVQRQVYTPYYYQLDYECVLDENNKVVTRLENSEPFPDQWQSVAILVLSEKDFCLNSKRLDGRNQMKKRHLELLGYKVVEIPHFEWYSMGLTDWTAKVDYLNRKIFS